MPVRPRALAWGVSVGALVSVVAVSMAASCGVVPDRSASDQGSGRVADAAAEVPRVTPESQQEKVRNGPPPPPPEPPDVRDSVTWRESTALGAPMAGGQLIDGVQLPSSGPGFSTWDPVRKRVPNRHWRRYGHDDVVRILLDVVDRYRDEFPDAPPLLVGDLSRPRGGDFGEQWGGRGHVSHQNGLDIDVYYPRTDGELRRATRPDQVNRRIAQWLVDEFATKRPQYVFTGPSLDLRGPAGMVQPLVNHDDHLHVRFFNPS